MKPREEITGGLAVELENATNTSRADPEGPRTMLDHALAIEHGHGENATPPTHREETPDRKATPSRNRTTAHQGGTAGEPRPRSVSYSTPLVPPYIEEYGTVEADLIGEGSVHHGKTAPSYGLETPIHLSGDDLFEYVSKAGSHAPYFPVPAALREALVGWRSVLGEVRGLMAVAQYALFSTMRTEYGVVFPYTVVYRCFGLQESAARNDDVYTEELLELYRERVDASFDYKPEWHKRGLARTITETGFPGDVAEIVRQYKVAPDSFEDEGGYVYLIDGSSANRRNTQAQISQDRLTDAMINDPAVPMTKSAEVIQTYLNCHLDDALFTNGRYGIVARLPQAIARVNELAKAGKKPFDSEEKADLALRQLAWVKQYPRPLYKPCDHSPRLKADHFNQLMNVPSVLRPALYNDRDVELDCDKAHMASLVVVARKLGISTPLLSEALEDASRDIWTEFADRFDAEALPTTKARRKAAKKSYAAVYGAGENNLYFEMLNEYRDKGGRFEGKASFAPFRPIMEHPLMAEIHETAQAVLEHIESEGGLHDAEGRYLTREMFEAKKPKDRAKTLFAYVCASYEQVLIAEAFRMATDEIETPTCYRRPAFQIWLYQADGFTLRLNRKASASEVVERVQRAVAAKAMAMGMPTRLSRV